MSEQADAVPGGRPFPVLSAAFVFGAAAMAAQTLLLRRFLWRFEAAETGVALFFAGWLFWTGMGAAFAMTKSGSGLVALLARWPWAALAVCLPLYFAQYALFGNLRAWLGIAAYETFPLVRLALGSLVANAPFCFAAGWVVPVLCHALERRSMALSRAFAWEALGAAAGGAALFALLSAGIAPDPRDEAEWFRYFPQASERPGRFETGGGTTFYGKHGGSFYALSSGGVSEVIPEGDRAVELAVLMLSQRPYATSALLLGQVPLAAGLALEMLRPDLEIVWCPHDAVYGSKMLAAADLATRITAAGVPPQQFLGNPDVEGRFDLVMVSPPPATTLEGAVWRGAGFTRAARRTTRRTGVALFGLGCDAAALTPEKAALLDVSVRAIRQVWPESGTLAAGAGGWWIASQVPGLAYGAEQAPQRFAMLKRESVYPEEAVRLLYDAGRAQRLIQQCPSLDTENAVMLPDEDAAETVLVAGLADAIRRDIPGAAPGAWLERLRTAGARLFGLLLVILWMFPVAVCGRGSASPRLSAAWLAACGALGLAVSLSVLYSVQMRFGVLYLWAGVGSCLYLCGLFCGNRVAEWGCRVLRGHGRGVRAGAVGVTFVQAATAFGILRWIEGCDRLPEMVGLCLAAGVAAGLAVPVALAVDADTETSHHGSRFAMADAMGAAVGGLVFAALVPVAGIWGAVFCFVALSCGLAICVLAGSTHVRGMTGLALLVATVLFVRQLKVVLPEELDVIKPFTRQGTPETEDRTAIPRISGIPRKVDVKRVTEQMRDGVLSTNTAAFWQ